MREAAYWIDKLKLKKHPEGGYFKEMYRSDDKILSSNLPERYEGDRNFMTSIYYLLEGDDISTFHRLKSDEIWHFYAGTSLRIFFIDRNGKLSDVILGPEPEDGNLLQAVIFRDKWFAAEIIDKSSYALVGCTVSPAFDFSDFEMADRNELIREYPDHESVIRKLTH